jgi:protein-tyrosine phosphatase
MWVWKLNWGEIRNDILIGSCPMTTADIDRIREDVGVNALLSLQTDECRAAFRIDYEAHLRHAERRQLLLVNTPMRDFDPPEQRQRLPAAVNALYRLLEGGHKVYVHCTAGINRSPLTVLAYLTFVEGMMVAEAIALIRRGRPEAEPYWESYYGCREDILTRHRNAIELRAWDLAQRNPHNHPDTNWLQAEQEILHEVVAGL